jgi:exodeoxyribonuclease V alpha subunit
MPATAKPTTEITGRVEFLAYQSPRFSAGTIMTGKSRVKFSVRGYVRQGDHIQLTGEWQIHEKYGKQFAADTAIAIVPADPDGLKIWLTWTVSGVGAVKAGRLVDEFGMELPDRCRSEPEIVAAEAGLPLTTVELIAKLWQEDAEKISAVTELAALGLTRHQVEILMHRFKGTAGALLKDDPYMLLGEVDGLGWAKIDEIAKKVGLAHYDPRRIRAAVEWTVKESQQDGHTCRDAGETHNEVLGKLGIRDDAGTCTEADIEKASGEAEEKKRLKIITGPDAACGWKYYATPPAYRNEEFLWNFFKAGRQPNPFIPPGNAERTAKMYRLMSGPKGKNITLDDGQLAAVETCLRHKVAVVTGGAGAGKTLVARAIAKSFSDIDIDVTYAAPTGKAARRLEELTGGKASTIHRLLGLGIESSWETDSVLPEGLVIVDEVSMVDSSLAYKLCKAAGPRTCLVLIGDDNQLSPVGAGAVLRDILVHNLAPVARLVGCHRQAGTLKTNCTKILEGKVQPSAVEDEPSPWLVHRQLDSPELIQKAVRRLFEEYLPAWKFDPVTDTQFLTAKHKGPFGTIYLNKVIQQMRNPHMPDPDPADDRRGKPLVGDKVIQTKNNYKLNVMNGHQGIVVATDPVLIVEFEDGQNAVYTPEDRGEVELGYVISVHKSQGSEWPCMVYVCPQAHAFMQHRNLFYTAVTRARRTAVVIGDDKGIRNAATRIETDRRQTILGVFATREGAAK